MKKSPVTICTADTTIAIDYKDIGVTMEENVFRELLPSEKRMLGRLLALPFCGSDELRRQARSLLARRINENGSLELSVNASDASSVPDGPAVEASYPVDPSPGEIPVRVNVLLHVKGGRLRMLEIYRDDSLMVAEPPDLSRFILFSRLMPR